MADWTPISSLDIGVFVDPSSTETDTETTPVIGYRPGASDDFSTGPDLASPTTTSEYAPFHWRLAAFLIDTVLISVVMTIAFYDRFSGLTFEQLLNDQTMSTASLAISMIYHSIWEASRWQGSPGKRLCRLRVVNLDGSPISFPRAILRQLGKVISNFLLLIGFLMVLVTPRRQALHDWLARCLVMRDR